MKKPQRKEIVRYIIIAIILVVGLYYYAPIGGGTEDVTSVETTVDTSVNDDISTDGTTSAEDIVAADGESFAENETEIIVDNTTPAQKTEYRFRNKKLLNQHYEKHGIEMGFASSSEYEQAASDVINNPDALTKTEAEDGDFIFYVESTNEFVVLSTDGYIRTYFLPNSGKKYYDRQ